METILNQIVAEEDYNDETYIYVFAHGYENDDGVTGIYMPDVYNPSSGEYEGFGYKRMVRKHLSKLHGKLVMLLQPCNSGGIVTCAEGILDPKRCLIVTAAAADESSAGVSWKVPLFTQALYDSCTGSVRTADANGNGEITLKEFRDTNPVRSIWVLTASNTEHTQIFGDEGGVIF